MMLSGASQPTLSPGQLTHSSPTTNTAIGNGMPDPLSPDLLRKMHAYWPAANYPSVGQIYLRGNPLLEIPLPLEHIKPRLLGHWGTTTGPNSLRSSEQADQSQ
jgi:phosphoketolase